ncbi:MAG TPA: ZIP family metal transporter [Steroidobacter sp.]
MGATLVISIAGAAAMASVVGGLIALWRTPTTLFMSSVLGFASGVLFATICFEMLPLAIDKGSLGLAIAGFLVGAALVYLLDLFVHRGKVAGPQAQQHRSVERFYHRRRPRGSEVTVLAAGTSVEELIEGLSIGVGASIEPTAGLLIALAIAIDNLSEGMSIGELVLAEAAAPGHAQRRRVLGWTGAIAVAVLGSALAGWLFLRSIPVGALAFLMASGAGGMFYLTVAKLVPQAEDRHYQQSAALSMTAGFLLIVALSEWS